MRTTKPWTLGAYNSTVRTADETQIARFWSDGAGTSTPVGHWNDLAEQVAMAQGNSTADNARLFAMLDITMADAGDCRLQCKIYRRFLAANYGHSKRRHRWQRFNDGRSIVATVVDHAKLPGIRFRPQHVQRRGGNDSRFHLRQQLFILHNLRRPGRGHAFVLQLRSSGRRSRRKPNLWWHPLGVFEPRRPGRRTSIWQTTF